MYMSNIFINCSYVIGMPGESSFFSMVYKKFCLNESRILFEIASS